METPSATITLDQQAEVSALDAAKSAVRSAHAALLTKPSVKTASAFATANTALHAHAIALGKSRRDATIARNWSLATDTFGVQVDSLDMRVGSLIAQCGPLTAANYLAALQGRIRAALSTLASPARANAIATTSTRDGASQPRAGSWSALLLAHCPPAVKVWAETPTATGKARSFNAHPLCHAYVPSNLFPAECDGCLEFREIDGIPAINDRPSVK